MFPADSVIYEQPLSEHLRICLRLEYLFQQVSYHIENESIFSTRAALTAILEIVNILDRPDLKTKLGKALSQRTTTLEYLEQAPGIDNKKLTDILNDLERLSHDLHATKGKLGQQLRENEFLKNIRLHLSKPGGASSFSCPGYHFWLQQMPELRIKSLLHWFGELESVHAIVKYLLQITRETGKAQVKFATQGFYQETFDPAIPYQIIRVAVAPDRKVFPEISVGRHRLSIHFYSSNFDATPFVDGRALRAMHDIPFKLACCVI